MRVPLFEEKNPRVDILKRVKETILHYQHYIFPEGAQLGAKKDLNS